MGKAETAVHAQNPSPGGIETEGYSSHVPLPHKDLLHTISFMCMGVFFPVRLSVYHMHEVLLKTKGGHWIPWDWKREGVSGVMWELETKPWVFWKRASSCNCWAISQVISFTGGCESPNMGLRDQTQVFNRINRTCCLPHLADSLSW